MLFKRQMTDIRLLAGIAFALVINSAAMAIEQGLTEVSEIDLKSWPITKEKDTHRLNVDGKTALAIWTTTVDNQERTMVMSVQHHLGGASEPVLRGYFFGSPPGKPNEPRKPFMLEYPNKGFFPHLEIGDHLHLIRLDTSLDLPEPEFYSHLQRETRGIRAPYALRQATKSEIISLHLAAFEALRRSSNRNSDLHDDGSVTDTIVEIVQRSLMSP